MLFLGGHGKLNVKYVNVTFFITSPNSENEKILGFQAHLDLENTAN